MLELDLVTRLVDGGTACADVTLTVAWGEVFGVAGAGRTTVARLAAGLLEPDSGAVRRTGERLGYLPADRGLYPRMRVFDQLEYLASLHGADPGSAVRAAEVWLARFGLRGRRFDRVQQLSSTERHRLCLAAAFVGSPDVLVLDSPFGGDVGDDTDDVVADVVREHAAAGAAVLLASDELGALERVCDRLAVLHDGRVVAQGAVEELRASARFELVFDGPVGWADALPGVVVLSVHSGRSRLALTGEADDQAVLAAAIANGAVLEFTRVQPGLAEVFRDVVGAG